MSAIDFDALEALEKTVDRDWSVLHTEEERPMSFIATKGDVICVPDPNFEHGDEATEKRFAFIVALRNAATTLFVAVRERDQLLEQIALRTPSALERDMQEIMRINNEMLARVTEFEIESSGLRDALSASQQSFAKALELSGRIATGREASLAKAVRERDAARAALQEIADRHIGDCPSALGDIGEEEWVRRCHRGLRATAREALATADGKDAETNQ